jgi:acyl-CoA synthetase (NDP forming)
VGASSDPTSLANRNFTKPPIDLGYHGKIYPIGYTGGEIFGLKIYPSLGEVPGPVDHVICSIPAEATPQLMRECVAKGVKVVHIFSSGFSETGKEEGLQLEQELVGIAREGGIRIIGPNCIGIYCPSWGMAFAGSITRESGRVGYFSQSGGNSRELTDMALVRGIRFSKVISFGNAADLDEVDYLEYFSQDKETEIIAIYIEGAKRGREFLSLLKETTPRKPVVIVKGGGTDAGERAVSFHTGALAGSDKVWDALCRQTGAVRAYSMEEMADLILAFSLKPPIPGVRAGIVSLGGGAGVQATDDCERAGLLVPQFPTEIQRELRKAIPQAGTSVSNPLDSSPFVAWDPPQFLETIRIVAACDQIDLVIVHIPVDLGFYRSSGPKAVMGQVKAAVKASETCDKPIALVLRASGSRQSSNVVLEAERECQRAGVPIYPSVSHAASAIAKGTQYYRSRRD